MTLLPSLRSVRVRLTLWNVAVVALTLVVLGGAVRLSARHNLMASVDADITARARRHQAFWAHVRPEWPRPWERRVPPGPPIGSRPPAAGRPGGANIPQSEWQARVVERLFNVEGQQVFPWGDGARLDPSAFAQAVGGTESYTTCMVDDEHVRVFSAPLRVGGIVRGVVQVAYSLADVDLALGNLNTTLLTLVPVALAAAGLGGMFMTGRMLRPLRDATQAAGRIGAEDLSRRLPVTGEDEFSKLASTFNQMLGRLESAFVQQRRFAADASHELRTPLTVIKANVGLALSRTDLCSEDRKTYETIDRASGVMSALVQDLLLLARSDAGQLEIHLRPTRLSEVMEVAVECVEPNGGPQIENRIVAADLYVDADAGQLTRLFGNLLDNAVRHTPESGRILLTAEAAADAVVVAVQDTGTGIAPEHLLHVCERFYRADAARSRAHGGSGLGLAICQSIVAAHGGQLAIESEVGAGTTVRVTLQRTAPPRT